MDHESKIDFAVGFCLMMVAIFCLILATGCATTTNDTWTQEELDTVNQILGD